MHHFMSIFPSRIELHRMLWPALPRGVQQPRGVPHRPRRLRRGDRGRREVHRAGAGVGQGVLAQGPRGAPHQGVRHGGAGSVGHQPSIDWSSLYLT